MVYALIIYEEMEGENLPVLAEEDEQQLEILVLQNYFLLKFTIIIFSTRMSELARAQS